MWREDQGTLQKLYEDLKPGVSSYHSTSQLTPPAGFAHLAGLAAIMQEQYQAGKYQIIDLQACSAPPPVGAVAAAADLFVCTFILNCCAKFMLGSNVESECLTAASAVLSTGTTNEALSSRYLLARAAFRCR